MNKQSFLLAALLIPGVLSAQKTIRKVNGVSITFTNSTKEGDAGDSVISIHVTANGKPVYHYLQQKTEGDCNSMTEEWGSYEIKDSLITFYTYWTKEGDAPVSPSGAMKRTYVVYRTGQVALMKASVYIEEGVAGRSEIPFSNGIHFLHTPPVTATEKQVLNAYIRNAEKKYGARFVSGKEKMSLIKEAKRKTGIKQ